MRFILLSCLVFSPITPAHALFLGEEAKEGQFPATVAILIPASDGGEDGSGYQHVCTAARIGKNRFLTAAHCRYLSPEARREGADPLRPELLPGRKIRLVHGVKLWKNAEGYASRVYTATIRAFHQHPSYRAEHVLETNTPPFDFSDAAVLETQEAEFDGVAIGRVDGKTLTSADKLVIGGYGAEWHRGSPNRLKFAPSSLTALEAGMLVLPAGVEFAGIGPASIMPGDSGGPVYLAAPGESAPLTIVGVNSRTGFQVQYMTRLDSAGPGAVLQWLQKLP